MILRLWLDGVWNFLNPDFGSALIFVFNLRTYHIDVGGVDNLVRVGDLEPDFLAARAFDTAPFRPQSLGGKKIPCCALWAGQYHGRRDLLFIIIF